jgi:hypothetical protein
MIVSMSALAGSVRGYSDFGITTFTVGPTSF